MSVTNPVNQSRDLTPYNPEYMPSAPSFDEPAGSLSIIAASGNKAFKALEIGGKIILIGNTLKVAIENSDKITSYVILPIFNATKIVTNTIMVSSSSLVDILMKSSEAFSIYDCLNGLSSQYSTFSNGSALLLEENPAYIGSMLNIQTAFCIAAVAFKGIEKVGSLLKSEGLSKIGKFGFWTAITGFGINTGQYLSKVYARGQ